MQLSLWVYSLRAPPTTSLPFLHGCSTPQHPILHLGALPSGTARHIRSIRLCLSGRVGARLASPSSLSLKICWLFRERLKGWRQRGGWSGGLGGSGGWVRVQEHFFLLGLSFTLRLKCHHHKTHNPLLNVWLPLLVHQSNRKQQCVLTNELQEL